MSSLHDVVTRWWKGDLGDAGAALDVVTAPAEALYRAATNARNALYDAGTLHSTRLDVPVVSIGNVAVGGTGKTPVTAWLARKLADEGAQPAVLHGGYATDEPRLHTELNPAIPVFVGRDRVAMGRKAIAAGARIIILDDAFQHRRIERDVDVVLVAAESWRGRRRALPRGPWREGVQALQRADWVVVTRRTASAREAASVVDLVRAAGAKQTAQLALRATEWLHQGMPSSAPTGAALLVTAIAAPDAFLENAGAAGASIRQHVFHPDHHEFSAADADDIMRRSNGGAIVTTAKDWVKLRAVLPADRVWVLRQTVEPETGCSELLERIRGLVR
jgi:tetraacyldisaccharide 4'-kinase